jgi:hypothetical protein
MNSPGASLKLLHQKASDAAQIVDLITLSTALLPMISIALWPIAFAAHRPERDFSH